MDIKDFTAFVGSRPYLGFLDDGQAKGTCNSTELQLYINSRGLSCSATFHLRAGGGLLYSIDTDLYPIDDPAFANGTRAVMEEIVEVLRAIESGRIYEGRRKGRPAVAIDLREGCILIYESLFSTSSTHYADLNEARSAGKFTRTC